ncbi:MAG: hypothetical protein LBJ64_12310, partial [Deltaproteobacteria bacterium]|nr:hypothetical protein [Deltaproteobacteria bacterium]
SIADKVWQAAESLPSQRRPGLILLADVCRRLIALEPLQPEYRFALGLTLFSLLADSPNWPDDLVFSGSPEAKEAFQEILESYETGLELLSDMDAGSPSSFPGESPQTASFPRPWGWPTPQSREFLSADPPPGAVLSSSTFQEKLGTILKMELNRLVALAEPELLPPWHQLKLASFFRRAAASGYPPPLDQMAFFRLADFYLTKAQNGLTDARASLADVARDAVGLLNKTPVAPSLLAQIHAERALLLAEISLLSPKDAEFLLSRSESLWRLAEEESPGSSRYSKARWAAWNSDKETLIPFLAHTAAEQENLLWPSFREALFEPAFKNLRESHWFKAAWFGYSR